MLITAEKDRYFLALAYQHAKKFSSDPRTQNGALLIRPDTMKILSLGANRFPDGIKHLPERLLPECKREYLEHAERDAIFSAIRQERVIKGAIMYVPWFACADCAKAIIAVGIKAVIGHLAPCMTETVWAETIKIGLTLLREANIDYHYYDGVVGVDNMLFSGQVVNR